MLSSVTVTSGQTASKSSSRDMTRPGLRANARRRSRDFGRKPTSAPSASRRKPWLISKTIFPNLISTQVIPSYALVLYIKALSRGIKSDVIWLVSFVHLEQ